MGRFLVLARTPTEFPAVVLEEETHIDFQTKEDNEQFYALGMKVAKCQATGCKSLIKILDSELNFYFH